MEIRENLLESLYERIESYGKTTYELSKLKIIETITKLLISLVPRLVVCIMIFLFAFFLSLGAGNFLGELLGNTYYGFLIVAAFYLVAAIIFYFFLSNWIKKPLSELIIKQLIQ